MIVSIDEVILQIRKGNKEALKLLFLMFEKHIRFFENKLLYSYNLQGFSREDFHMIICHDTINILKRYEMDKGPFYAYWKVVESRNINELFERLKKQSDLVKAQEEFQDYHSASFQENLTEEEYQLKEEYEKLLNQTLIRFGTETEKVLRLWSQGYSYKEISSLMKLDTHRVNYLLHKAFDYLKKINNLN